MVYFHLIVFLQVLYHHVFTWNKTFFLLRRCHINRIAWVNNKITGRPRPRLVHARRNMSRWLTFLIVLLWEVFVMWCWKKYKFSATCWTSKIETYAAYVDFCASCMCQTVNQTSVLSYEWWRLETVFMLCREMHHPPIQWSLLKWRLQRCSCCAFCLLGLSDDWCLPSDCRDWGTDPGAKQVQVKVGSITSLANRGAGNLVVNFQKAARFSGVSQHNLVKAGRVKKQAIR